MMKHYEKHRRVSSPYERGSALMLMPAAVLVMMVLGAFAVDATLVFLAEREVANLSAGMANDIASAAIDDAVYYGQGPGGEIVLDRDRAQAIASLALAAYQPQYLQDVRVTALDVTGTDVTVTVAAAVDYLFSAAIPSAPNQAPVSATSTATARQD